MKAVGVVVAILTSSFAVGQQHADVPQPSPGFHKVFYLKVEAKNDTVLEDRLQSCIVNKLSTLQGISVTTFESEADNQVSLNIVSMRSLNVIAASIAVVVPVTRMGSFWFDPHKYMQEVGILEGSGAMVGDLRFPDDFCESVFAYLNNEFVQSSRSVDAMMRSRFGDKWKTDPQPVVR